MTEEKETKAVKRGRGRPPKPDSEKKTNVAKNIDDGNDGEPPVKRGRGRPKGSTKAKGRGRPKSSTNENKKVFQMVLKLKNILNLFQSSGRGRGRPRKNVAAEEEDGGDESEKEGDEDKVDEADENSS